MSETEDTIKQEPTLADVMKAITDLAKGFSEYKRHTDTQPEVIREGIFYNASRFDRLDANLYSVRSDISNLKADVRDLTEEIRQSRKSLV